MLIDPHMILREYLVKHGLKASRQRDLIVEVFLATGGHVRMDELLTNVRNLDHRVSQATVYRTMKLLIDCGIAAARNFSDGHTRYERSDATGEHHDHLICTQCGQIIEFVDPRIEQMQERVAKAHGFVVTHHKMELYGLCNNCKDQHTCTTVY